MDSHTCSIASVMNTPVPTTLRRTPRPSQMNSDIVPTTPTLRLLEITCGITRDQAETLLTGPSRRHQATFPDRPSALNAYQAFGVVTCCFLLSAIVAAVIISLG